LSLTPESGHLVEVPGLGNQTQQGENMDDLVALPEVTNHRRTQWARAALEAFARQTGQSVDLPDGDTEVIGDLLCDLHHWTDAHGVMWDQALARGEMHYEAERMISPAEALSKIAAHLSGKEWNPYTIGVVADIVRQSGFDVQESAS
jgi:hypothetical protein